MRAAISTADPPPESSTPGASDTNPLPFVGECTNQTAGSRGVVEVKPTTTEIDLISLVGECRVHGRCCLLLHVRRDMTVET